MMVKIVKITVITQVGRYLYESDQSYSVVSV